MFNQYHKSGVCAIYHRIPISLLDAFRSEMRKHSIFYKIRYRGPRFNVPSAARRGYISKASTCLKEDATHFSAYYY